MGQMMQGMQAVNSMIGPDSSYGKVAALNRPSAMAQSFNPMHAGNRMSQPGLSSDQNAQPDPVAAMAGTAPTSAAGNPAQSADEARLKILQLFRGY